MLYHLYYHFFNLYLPYRTVHLQEQRTYQLILPPERTVMSGYHLSIC